MKKILLFVAVVSAFSFASCKKDHVCSCTSTNSDGTPGGTGEVTYVNTTKGVAKKGCVSYTQTSGSNTETVTCKLK